MELCSVFFLTLSSPFPDKIVLVIHHLPRATCHWLFHVLLASLLISPFFIVLLTEDLSFIRSNLSKSLISLFCQGGKMTLLFFNNTYFAKVNYLTCRSISENKGLRMDMPQTRAAYLFREPRAWDPHEQRLCSLGSGPTPPQTADFFFINRVCQKSTISKVQLCSLWCPKRIMIQIVFTFLGIVHVHVLVNF